MFERIEAVIEALLFAAGEEVALEEIASVIGLKPKETAGILNIMIDKYKSQERGIMLRNLGGSYQLCTKKEFYDDIKSFFEPRHMSFLSNAAMETLAIIAYNQPVTRTQIESVRGVNCDGVVNRLLDKGLIYEAGKSDTPGRPMMYGTTKDFLRALGLGSLDEMPQLINDDIDIIDKEENEE